MKYSRVLMILAVVFAPPAGRVSAQAAVQLTVEVTNSTANGTTVAG